MAEQSDIYTYGNNPPYQAERYSVGVTSPIIADGFGQLRVPGYFPIKDTVLLTPPLMDEDRYHQALEDINCTWGTISDPQTGKTFEIALANLAAPADNGIDAELSTFTSSISGNPGNAVEFAENAALQPDRQRIYIASFGNGGSSYWESRERQYIRKTGRFTQSSGEALPTLEALARALKAADFIISRFSANSAGGAHATALMAALPEGQVTHAYLKSRPNISNHKLGLAWGAGILINDILDDMKYDKASKDPWKLTGKMIDEAREFLPNIYSDEAENRHKTLRQKAGSSHRIGKILTDLTAISRGGVEEDYPAEQDTVMALWKQPGALVTYHFPAHDRLYKQIPLETIQFLT
ncbi:MAG: hypothetical protein AAB541_03515, partial [Patescibacteria group bacterium]